MDHDKLMDNFVAESFGHLTIIESGLIELERLGDGADYSLINGIFRSIHTIKGASGFLGLNKIGLLTHVMEDALSLLREKKLQASKELAAALFRGTDLLKAILYDINSSESMNIDREIEIISQAFGISQKDKKKVRVKEKITGGKNEQLVFDVPETELQNLIQQGSYLYFIRVYLKKDLISKGQTPFDFINNMESTGRFLDAFLDLSVIGGLEDCLDAEMAFVFIYATVLEPDLVYLALDLPADRITEIETGYLKEVYQQELTRFLESFPQEAIEKGNIDASSGSRDDENHQSGMTREDRFSRIDERLHVRVDALDELMNLASELVIGGNQLAQIVQPFINNTAGLDDVIQRISRLTAEIREKITLMRRHPVSMLFGRYNRLVRDIANLLGKDAVLQTSGDEVELEKTIIDALSGPMTHMIRNCLDHGIETPELRLKAGKPPCGVIRLNAFYKDGSVNIEVIDDGAGIDLVRVREKAIETNLVTMEKLAEMSDKDILKLIFAPGFSTAGQVSDISGRGVGMDVVKTEIERIGGTVDIDTIPGKGTLIRMAFRLKLAVIPDAAI